MRVSHLTILVLLFVALVASTLEAAIPRTGLEEITWGDEAAVQVEKDNKILNDPALIARVESVGTPIAIAANNNQIDACYGAPTITEFAYTFKIIESDDVNAFSVAAGHIYICKGLLDFCQSDHELAGVIAHEVAHASHHHMIRLLREQNRLENQMALLMLAGLVGNIDSRDLSNVMAGAQFYKIAKMSGYGQLAEQDADTAAVKYMKQAGFNPVGMLTFLERMAERPDVVNWGIMQTHPRTDNRVRSIKAVLAADGTEINRRAVTSWSTAKVKCIDSEAAPCYEVMIAGRTVCRVADQTRASEAATRINAALDAGLQLHQVRVVGNQLEANGQPILAITDQDLALSKQTANAATLQAAQAVRCVLLRDIVNDIR